MAKVRFHTVKGYIFNEGGYCLGVEVVRGKVYHLRKPIFCGQPRVFLRLRVHKTSHI